MKLELSNKLELHYHFTDNTHTMDAVVRNKCEHEILSIIKYISESLDVNFVVETEPYQDGGLKEIWSFTGRNGIQITIIIAIITLVLSRIPLKNDNVLTTLQKENLKLQNEKLELDIQLLKTTLKENKEEKLYLSEKDFNSIVAEFDESYRIIKHKSNFYKSLSSCLKIKKISTTKFLNKIQVGSPFIVKKDQFPYYIRLSDKLPSIIDEEANIEIISPVLKKGNYKWKGIYDSKPIEFYMKDNIFKESIVNQKVEFKNGVAIKCVLEIFRKIDEIGEEQVTHYSVNTVLAQCTNDLIKETEQGKKYKKKKAYAAMQMTFELQ